MLQGHRANIQGVVTRDGHRPDEVIPLDDCIPDTLYSDLTI
jgi:hypothetical protein